MENDEDAAATVAEPVALMLEELNPNAEQDMSVGTSRGG